MSSGAKSRLAGLFVLLCTLWPLVQLTLVRTYDVSPWKLGGWGMYSVPTRIPYLMITVARPGDEPFRLGRTDPVVTEEMQTFMTRRMDLGLLARPDALAERIFETYPEIDRIWLTFVERRIDRKTALMVRSDAQYPYVRPAR